MPDTETSTPTIYCRTWVWNGKTETAHYPGITPSAMAMYALKYRNICPRDFTTFEAWETALTDANDFATYCVDATVDADGWCDPTISFGTLWAAYQREPSS